MDASATFQGVSPYYSTLRKRDVPLTVPWITTLVLAILALSAGIAIGAAGMTQALAIKRVYALTSVIALPPFLLAFVVILVKESSVTLHNNSIKSVIEKVRTRVNNSEDDIGINGDVADEREFEGKEVYHFTLNFDSIDADCDQVIRQINECTKESKFLSLYSKYGISRSGDSISIALVIS